MRVKWMYTDHASATGRHSGDGWSTTGTDKRGAGAMLRPTKGDREPAPKPSGPGLGRADSHLPTNFGRYQVKGLVGEGSMGRVYRAFDPMAQRVVAIKTLKSEYLTS